MGSRVLRRTWFSEGRSVLLKFLSASLSGHGARQWPASSSPSDMAPDLADQHLRHIEKDILIPKIMREKARKWCSEQVEDFTRCCKDSGFLMAVKCWKENSALKDCLTAYYNDPAFYEECKLEYLKERGEFRRTGALPRKGYSHKHAGKQ